MFIEYFGFKQNPFSVANDSCFFSADLDNLKICERVIRDLKEGVSPILLIGPAGAKKLQLLEHLSTQLPADMYPINPVESELNYAASVLACIDRLIENQMGDKKLLLLIDNAHEISDAELKLLLLLTKHQAEKIRSFQMIWCGEEGLDEKLRRMDVKKYKTHPFNYRFDSLDETQVKHYINAQLATVGYSTVERGELFSPDAIKMVTLLSQGVPKTINLCCSHALGLASLDCRDKISERHIQEAFKLCVSLIDKPIEVMDYQQSTDGNEVRNALSKKITIRIQINKPQIDNGRSPRDFRQVSQQPTGLKNRKRYIAGAIIGLSLLAFAGFQYFDKSGLLVSDNQGGLQSVIDGFSTNLAEPGVPTQIAAIHSEQGGDKNKAVSAISPREVHTVPQTAVEKPILVKTQLSPPIQHNKPSQEKNVDKHEKTPKNVKPSPVMTANNKQHSIVPVKQKPETKLALNHIEPVKVAQKKTPDKSKPASVVVASLAKQLVTPKPHDVTVNHPNLAVVKTQKIPNKNKPAPVVVASLAKQLVTPKPHNMNVNHSHVAVTKAVTKLPSASYVMDAQEIAARNRAANRLRLEHLGVKFDPDSLTAFVETK